jgi:hypothetical protein
MEDFPARPIRGSAQAQNVNGIRRLQDNDARTRPQAKACAALGAPPSERELLAMVVLSGTVMWMTAFLLHRSTNLVIQFGDNAAYLVVANGILHWNFHDVFIQHFMGYPYLIAAVSLLVGGCMFRQPSVCGALRAFRRCCRRG